MDMILSLKPLNGNGRFRMYRLEQVSLIDEIFTPIETGGSTNNGYRPCSTDTGYILTNHISWGV